MSDALEKAIQIYQHRNRRFGGSHHENPNFDSTRYYFMCNSSTCIRWMANGIIDWFYYLCRRSQWLSFLKHSNTPLPIFPQVACDCLYSRISILEDSYISSALAVICLLFLSIPVFTDEFAATDSFLCITSKVLILYRCASGYPYLYKRCFIGLVYYNCNLWYGYRVLFYGRFFGKHKLNDEYRRKKRSRVRLVGA